LSRTYWFISILILSTFVKPTIAFVIPLTVPVNVGLAKFAFKFNAIVWLILVYLHQIYYPFDKPTIDLVIPVNNAPLPTKALALHYQPSSCIAATTTNNNHGTFGYFISSHHQI
jgi:hypothetical protein